MDPEEILIFDHIMNDLVDAEQDAEEPARQLHVTQQVNPFETLSEEKFRKNFRVSKDLAREIIDMVSPFIQENIRVSALSVKRKVLVTLKMLATGSYQEIIGGYKYLSVSQSSASRCIRDVCQALCQPQIFNQWVYFPRNLVELRQLRHRFFEKYGFPGIIGCIDCTHVAIVRPKTNDEQYPEHIYVNRKQYHSINVQLICDENFSILNVNARFPGSNHDAHIWRQSAVSNTMATIYRHNPDDTFFLIGDSGYPLRPYLITPVNNPGPGTNEERFNDQFCSIRSTIERCNGVLKNRFRCLLKHRVLHYAPNVASTIINACVVLHNMCIAHNIPEPEIDEEMLGADLGMYPEEEDFNVPANNREVAAARLIRNRIIHNFLTIKLIFKLINFCF